MKVDSGLVMQHDADLPSNSGLGSSSAFTVGLLHALHALQGCIISKKRLGLEAVHVEQDLVREAVGSQDQLAAAFGGLNVIEFSRHNNIEITPLPISGTNLRYLQSHLLLYFTGFPRVAAEIEKDKLKNLDLHKNELETMHTLVDKAVQVLSGDPEGYDELGRLLQESWRIKRSLSAKVSSNGIDEIYQRAMAAGALGGKLLGAGGGGFILFFVPLENQEGVRAALSDLLQVPFRFDTLGTQLIYYTEE